MTNVQNAQSPANINIVAQFEIRGPQVRFDTSSESRYLMAYGDEIGLHRAIVRIASYHPKWPEYFVREKELLLKMMGETVLDIRHIGSTSIAGMPAKPILDILVGVRTLAAVEPFVEDLSLSGYEDRGNGDQPRTQIFCKRLGREKDSSSEFL